MEARSAKPYIIVILLLFCTVSAQICTRPTLSSDILPIKSLPDKIADYRRQTIFSCQNIQCMRQSTSENTCPFCGGSMDIKAPSEKKFLSPDTVIDRAIYTAPGNRQIIVSTVLEGANRTDIHTPQTCLRSQGYEVNNQKFINIDVHTASEFRVADLTLRKPAHNSLQQDYGTYIYWFVSENHATPYNYKRLFWQACDRLFKGQADRWAYITVAPLSAGSGEVDNSVKEFISALNDQLLP